MVSGRQRRHLSIGAASLAVGGAAFALIQILQGTISAFNPRPVVSVLISVFAALVGSTLGRMRQNTIEARRLTALLRVWPLTSLDDCDALTLGVFPARQLELPGVQGSNDPLPPYVPREIDDGLRRALQAGGLVIVVGPERSGKSRTVYEAGRAVLGSRQVVLPFDGSSLSELADEDWSGCDADAVWWLDDLERFLEEMGSTELERVADGGLQVVATIREERWQSLLRGVGEDGERGRRLRGAAQVFRLPATLAVTEAADAAGLLGDIDLSRGLGEALRAPDEGSIPRPAPRARPGRRPRDPALGLVAVGTVATAVALALVIGAGGFSPVKAPPIGAQIDAIRQRAAAADEVTLIARPVHLHGFDQASYLFVMQPASQGSDELRIYDVVDGFLRLRLDFQPHTATRASSDAEAVPLSIQASGAGFDYGLEGLRVRDLFNNGEDELIGDYSQLPLGVGVKLPILVSWDDIAQRYRLHAMLTQRPSRVPQFRLGGDVGTPYLLRDTSTGIVLRAWPVTEYLVAPAGGSSSAWLVFADDAAGTRGRSGLELDSYELALSAGGVKVKVGNSCGAFVVRADSLSQRQLFQSELGSGARGVAAFPGTELTCVD